ncbi:shewanella-like protein phosphatase 2 [Sesamum indicum]|uniref:Shewanella-like protein phosphatase 2 n=1 Tax=Sesamum indicum TaxID=4182 RepID=A0A6I9TTV9_SESIN|nr:shewanella-like protein phosphatase 2 [Sesamum indicum]XP_011089354.1 shewanella-like protein phosphatase 2 [Sesamum indicum]XP_020552549.1 shewanella-like protein phosphatase 2 [Sesamum indicum]
MANTEPPSSSNSAVDCGTVPSLVSSFIDTFVDFSVSGGLFLPPDPDPIKDSNSPLQTVFDQPTRLIAIGDLHGDLPKAKKALRLAGLIGPEDRWSGGSTTVVQVGDIFDRGGDEIKLLYFFEKLKREAAKSGGLVITMNGNHEIMNVDGDFRYVTPEGLREFENWGVWQCVGNSMKKRCDGMDENVVVKDLFDGVPDEFPRINKEFQNGARARFAALRPSGLIANRFLSKNQTVVVVGDSVFAHGGLLQKHVLYGLERVNEEVRDWIRGVKEKVANQLVRGRNSIVWLRSFSHELAKDCDCSMLEHVLETIPGVKRMIMGHTIQSDGINAICGNRAIRVDVGMSKLCGDKFPEVLEINEHSELRVLTSNPLYFKGYEAPRHASKNNGLGSLIPEERARQVEVNA